MSQIRKSSKLESRINGYQAIFWNYERFAGYTC